MAESNSQQRGVLPETSPQRSRGDFAVSMGAGSDESSRFEKLNKQRISDGKTEMRATQNRNTQNKKTRNVIKNKTGAGKILDIKKETQAAKELPLAFTAIDPLKDGMQLFIIGMSILADLFTLIPIVNTFFAIIFSVLIWFLYALDGHFKRSPARKIVTSSILQGLEVFGFGIVGILPLFTTSALINYWFTLADRKVSEKEAAKNIF